MTIPMLTAVALFAPVDLRGTGTADTLDFATEVRPILARRCFACHGNDEETREAGLRLDSFHEATLDRDGFPAVVPGDPDESEVMVRITDEFDPMPPAETGDPLSAEEVDILRRWIESGAEYAPHWAFVPPARPDLPSAAEAEPIHPVDAFVHRKHQELGLDFSDPADDFTLFRRLSLDLTGLPPTPEAARAFAESTDPDKYEAAVHSLLSSPAYAERWAAVWLDLARYADSSGHGSDPLREIWRYRDWVIEAFDENMPFDEFTVQQLAGDLLPEANDGTRLATAFHRNTMTNTEGGTDDEEFRVLAVKDRVNTTLSVWMGLTAGCAECHSHKYDPISHVEYYQLFDLFNQTADTDRNDDAPRMPTPTAAQAEELSRLNGELAALEETVARRSETSGPEEAGAREAAVAALLRPAAWTGIEAGAVFWSEGAAPTAVSVDAHLDPAWAPSGKDQGPAGERLLLTQLDVRAMVEAARPITASAVRIELPGKNRILSLAEVQLLDGQGEVIPAGFTGARQSTTEHGGAAERAIDGRVVGFFDSGTVTHTETSSDPYWEGALEEPLEIGGVRVWPRTDRDHEARTHGFRVVLLDGSGGVLWRSAPAPAPPGDAPLPGTAGAAGGYLDVGPVVGEPLMLTAASVTHEQEGFGAQLAVDGLASVKDGWAVGRGAGTDQKAVFALPPLEGARGLLVTLRQDGKARQGAPSLGLAVTSASPPPLAVGTLTLAALGVAPSARTEEEARLVAAAVRRHDPELQRLAAETRTVEEAIAALNVPTTPVMVELPPAERRKTHVLVRGNFLQPGEEVEAGVPAVFPPLPDGVEPDRLALAHWMVSDQNPLTARVTVNRIWARLFGRGLVASEGDFGSQGELPTHKDLLDWLAVEFMEGGWDHRALLETIVTSRTYRQASTVRPRSRELDPTAQWLSRYPRQRLEAEMVRDTALHAAGLLSTKRFGPSVYPPQPEGLWKAAFNGQREWTESVGEDRYRRGLYVFLRRTIPYPMLATFDAPSRETCTVQRIPTNTPLQAFVTLNDPVFVEASQALARRSLVDAGHGDPAEACRSMLWFALGSPPAPEHVSILTSLYGDALAAFDGDPEAAADFGFPAGEDLSLPESATAAWTLVASAALNLDGALTKE